MIPPKMRDPAGFWVPMARSTCVLIALALLAAGQERPCVELAGRGQTWKSDPGPALCETRELAAIHDGERYRRIDIGITGEAQGAIAREGARGAYFTTAPEFVFVQTGNPQWQPATVRYEAAEGMGVTLLLPGQQRWNGKLFLTAHGAGRSHAAGNLKPWDSRVSSNAPLEDLTRYELLMLEKGYAVAKTHRSSDKKRGDCAVRLADGGERAGYNITETPHILLDFLAIARGALEREMGAPVKRAYFYGHSAGGRNGRLANYIPGLNRGGGGSVIDGFLIDDAGAGLWLPVLWEGGEDRLLMRGQDRAQFMPQMDITHLLYNALKDEPSPEWVSSSYLMNKRRNVELLKEKGLAAKHRYYEVLGVSHSGGESPRGQPGDVRSIALWRLFDGLIDRLDEWVETGQAPPENWSDDAALAERAEGTGALGAVALPEVACPLGVYFQYPASLGEKGIGNTGFASFDARKEEPLDGRGVFVDMNRNGYHDRRESVEAAWRRLGLLGARGRFTREAYVGCIERAAMNLVVAGLFSEASARDYVAAAREATLPGPAVMRTAP